ncbi:MAG: M20/M25/M40 family metallo-hydrolase [Gemmatimonadetes bacterium]|nr:M20/M25/M40 family metallo-hydrolase [Gemmatimonadota bacterium]
MRLQTLLSPLALSCLTAVAAPGQAAQYPTQFSPALARLPAVRDALAYVDAHFGAQVAEWIRVTEIPAPSRAESRRAAYVREQLEALGLAVTVDSIGNVFARLRGSAGGPTLVFAAHLDTVHPIETDLTVTRKDDGTLHAPGVFDNSASVANLLAAARALKASGLRTKGDVILLFTAQEELGLKGMAHWLDHNPRPDHLVALDGGLGPVLYGALGIYWSRMVFSGAGSHTNTSRGKPHPARAAARCILDIYTVPLPPPDAEVGAVYNVGMIRGGHVVNAIPEEVAFTVDLRTVDPALLERLDSTLVATCQAAARAESVGFRREWVQRSAAGGTPAQLASRRAHPIVQTAIDILKHLGWDFSRGPEAVASGSTDSNVGVVRGIPTVAVGRSRGGDQHTLVEWAHVESARIGTKQIILLAAALAGVQ